MAYFAKLDTNSIVVSVIKVHDDIATSEQAGIDFLNTLYKTNDTWKQTFRDNSQRKNFAAKRYTYDEAKDAFIPAKPYKAWVLNETTCVWEPPIPKPADAVVNGGHVFYDWDDTIDNWSTVLVAWENAGSPEPTEEQLKNRKKG